MGKQQAHELGEFFRIRYNGLLQNGEYSPKKIYIISSDQDRSIMTAATVAAGLFPPIKNQTWHNQLAWQPVNLFNNYCFFFTM